MPKHRLVGTAVLAGLALLLVGAVAFQVLYRLREVPQTLTRPRIAAAVPHEVEGWKGLEESLGLTESVNAVTLKTLNLDDYVYRRFQRGTVSFTVYAAFWAAGKMPTRLVASHTPDRCWTENGMRCVDQRYRQSYRLNGRPLFPAEYRVFTAAGGDPGASGLESGDQRAGSSPTPVSRQLLGASAGRTYVVYWHTVGGELYDYGERFNAIPDPWRWWKDVVTQAAYGSREQLFVRIASETPLEDLWREPGFQTVMAAVADLGLWENAKVRRAP